uniref:Uncharacterized protein n=1 Tax=Nucleocytoviricota sp. TaxID=2809609 RepID=A0A9E8G4C3_9VIRU|nr:hypothetical protein [Nucleocytoviricota sp.]UZT29133.1 hypothetical protein [Nucleocytoviricota sp.]
MLKNKKTNKNKRNFRITKKKKKLYIKTKINRTTKINRRSKINRRNKKKFIKNFKKGGNISHTNYFIELSNNNSFYVIDFYSEEIIIDVNDNIDIEKKKLGMARIEQKNFDNKNIIFILSELKIYNEYRNRGFCNKFINLIYEKFITDENKIIFIQHIVNLIALKCYYKTLFYKVLINPNKSINHSDDINKLNEHEYIKNILSLIVSKNKLSEEFVNKLITTENLKLFDISI